MFYVYILESENYPDRVYVGFSQDLKKRVEAHNSGKNVSTRHGRPWRLVFYASFINKPDALRFEEYLKMASGKAFAKKQLLPS